MKPGPLSLGLVGHPIARSLSPRLHRAALAHSGRPGSYELFDVPAASGLAPIFARLARRELDGLNVTVPHKLAALSACDRVDALARRVGAVNTLMADASGAIAGWNTDLPGLVAAVRARWPDVAWTGPALVIGAGGAAPAAILAAEALGAGEIRVWNRTFERAAALVERLGLGVARRDAREAASEAALVLQAASLGMDLEGEALAAVEHQAAAILSGTAPHARVVDLVYRPSPTAFMRAAEALGREACGGLGMLVEQAALSFELWTGARDRLDASSRADGALVAAMAQSVRTPRDHLTP